MKNKRLNVTVYIKTTQKVINFDKVTKENISENNANWVQVIDHPYKILNIEGSGSGKVNTLFNIISH